VLKQVLMSDHFPVFGSSTRKRGVFTSQISRRRKPGLCKTGSDHPSAKVLPLETSDRQLSMYDPKRKVVAHQHLLQHSTPVFAKDAKQHVVDQRGLAGKRRRWLVNTKMLRADR